MDQLLREFHRLAKFAYSKLSLLLKQTSPMTIQLTGLLGIAAVLAGVYHLRMLRRRQRQNRPQRDLTVSSKPESSFGGMGEDAMPIPLAHLKNHFQGIKTITVSIPGVLLEEWDPESFEESATVKPDAAAIIQELCAGMHIYLIAHVNSDLGESVIRTALESAKLLGPGLRELPPHRLVFCETLKGKVSMVRQIEPQMHIDGSSETIEELHRFIPSLYQVVRKGNLPATCKRGLVASGPTLADTLNVQVYN